MMYRLWRTRTAFYLIGPQCSRHNRYSNLAARGCQIFLTSILAHSWSTPKPVVAAPNDSIPMGWIVEVRGSVQLKRLTWREYHTADVGTALYQGDLLRPATGGIARVRCAANNIIWPVPAGQPSGISNGCPLPSSQRLQCPNGDCPRSNLVAINPNIPYIISPRKTRLLTVTPTLHWNAVTGVKSYTVQLKGEGLDWKTQVSGTSVVYSGEQSLKPGVYYSLIVETDTGRFSLEENVSEPGFKLLEDNEAQTVRAAVDQLAKEKLNEEAIALSLAYLYIQHDLKAEAIEMLEALVKKSSQTAAVYRTLGDLYKEVELAKLAESNYLKAIELTAADAIDGQAEISANLGELYTALGETDKAIEYIKRSLTNYQVLEDSQRVRELENQLRELERLKSK